MNAVVLSAFLRIRASFCGKASQGMLICYENRTICSRKTLGNEGLSFAPDKAFVMLARWQMLLVCDESGRCLARNGWSPVGAVQSLPLNGFPGIVASQVLPDALQTPINLDLAIREMF